MLVGSFGDVYEVEYLPTGDSYALKVSKNFLPPEKLAVCCFVNNDICQRVMYPTPADVSR